jgi:hypothetical protein
LRKIENPKISANKKNVLHNIQAKGPETPKSRTSRCFEMTVYTVEQPFRAKTGKIRKGQVIAMPEDKAGRLLKAGKIAEVQPCPACEEYAWWLSTYGVLMCGVCHPPASAALVKRWIGDPEAYVRMKMTRPAVLLSFEDFKQRRLQNAGNGGRQ